MKNLMQISDEDIHHEYCRRFTIKTGDIIQSSEAAAQHLRLFFKDEPDRESFVVIFLNGKNQVISCETLFIGTLTTSAVYPREVLKAVLKHQAAAIIIGHNHPSGNTEPSRDDITITRKLKDALATIDVPIHDHLIIAKDRHTSFVDRGLM